MHRFSDPDRERIDSIRASQDLANTAFGAFLGFLAVLALGSLLNGLTPQDSETFDGVAPIARNLPYDETGVMDSPATDR